MFLLILGIGVGLLAYGIYVLSLRIKLVPLSKIITGTVVGMKETLNSKRHKVYYPIIEYSNPATNEKESFQHDVGNGRSKHNVGDNLELKYYNDGNKKLVLINAWSEIWFTPIAIMIAGVIFTAFGVWMALS
jgi:hypothetical protein